MLGTNIPSAVVSTQWWQYNVDIIVIAHESFLEQLLSGTINIEILERQITLKFLGAMNQREENLSFDSKYFN
jgi:hypothetical protein